MKPFKMVTIGGSDEGGEFETYFVTRDGADADRMLKDQEYCEKAAIAHCSSYTWAARISDALNYVESDDR
jgi:hypothetical protein